MRDVIRYNFQPDELERLIAVLESRASVPHYYATGILRRGAALYDIECGCGLVFTGTHRSCAAQMTQHLDAEDRHQRHVKWKDVEPTLLKLKINLAAYSRQKRGLSHEEYRDTVALEESIDRDYESA